MNWSMDHGSKAASTLRDATFLGMVAGWFIWQWAQMVRHGMGFANRLGFAQWPMFPIWELGLEAAISQTEARYDRTTTGAPTVP